jgi:hypothetical protein
MGPRQITGWSSSAKKPIEMHFTPCATGGTINFSMTSGGSVMPSIFGTENP